MSANVPPSVPIAARPSGGAPPHDLLTAGMIDSLRKTKPWVRFLSILGFVAAGFMIVAGVGVSIFGLVATGDSSGPFSGALMVGLGLVYVLFSLFYIIPSRYLSRYAKAINTAMVSTSKTAAVEEALRYQKSFWKFVGIMMLVMLVLYPIAIIAAIAIPSFFSAMKGANQKRTSIPTILTGVASTNR